MADRASYEAAVRHSWATLAMAITWCVPALLPMLAQAPSPATVQSSTGLPDAAQIQQVIHDVANLQLRYLQRSGAHFRYHLHRVDPKEDTLRDVIESAGGNVTRLLEHNGQALTTAENEGDRDRLTHYIESGDLRKKEHEGKRFLGFGVELIDAMPNAMLYTPTPDQPQLPQHNRRQIVLDYVPNPAYRPTTMAQGLLSGLKGRLWIDAADHHLIRIEINLTRNLDLAMGLLARVYTGGTIEYDQRRIADGVYAYTHIRMHLRLRELMLKTVPYDSDLVATDIEPLLAAPIPEKAVQVLLDDTVKTR